MEYDPNKSKLHAITTGTDPVKCEKLMHSAKHHAWEIDNIAANKPWQGGEMAKGPGGGHKVNFLKNHITGLPPEDLILFTDAYDVFYADNIQTVYERYIEADAEILFAAEKVCWPDENLADKFPDTENSYRFLNSGIFIGSVSALNRVFSHYGRLDNSADDQRYYTKMFLDPTCPAVIKLDTSCSIFQTHSLDIIKEIEYGTQLYNPEVGYCPCIYHGNGGFPKAIQKFEELFNDFYPEFAENAKLQELINVVETETVPQLNRPEVD